MTDIDYASVVDALIVDFTQRPMDFLTAEIIVRHLIPDHPLNLKVFVAAKTTLKITPIKMYAAMERWKRALDKKHQELEQDAGIEASFGGSPTNEREAVAMLIAKRGITMSYDGTFHNVHGNQVKFLDVQNDIVLTAAAAGLTPPRGDLMSASVLKAALAEWRTMTKEEERRALFDRLNTPMDGDTRRAVMAEFRSTVCDHYFQDPAFGFAAVLKFIWQVKRKMAGLAIIDHHMLVIQGPQKTGKTEFCRMLIEPIKEVAVETSVEQVLDDRNSALKAHYAAYCDEMTRNNNPDFAKFKLIITAADFSARVLHTHELERVKVNLTMIGTTNPPLGNIVYDATGMRRFIEAQPLSLDEIRPFWSGIVDFDWAALWVAVDPNDADPIMTEEFMPRLFLQQEEMRSKSNVEVWLDDFDWQLDTKHVEREITQTTVSIYAKPLYAVFQEFENRYFPGSRGTSITTWGKTFKTLIATGRFPRWSHVTIPGKKVNYTYIHAENVIHFPQTAEGN